MDAGLAIFAVTAQLDYWHFGIALVGTAFGMGVALMASGTTLILMGLPRDRRTLSSAVHDVTREAGSAIGAAVLASPLVTLYGDRIAPALAGLPDPAAAAKERRPRGISAGGDRLMRRAGAGRAPLRRWPGRPSW